MWPSLRSRLPDYEALCVRLKLLGEVAIQREVASAAAPRAMAPPAEGAGERAYDLDEGISGFAGGLSED